MIISYLITTIYLSTFILLIMVVILMVIILIIGAIMTIIRQQIFVGPKSSYGV